LQNDHKDLMNKIEQHLYTMHATGKSRSTGSGVAAPPAAAAATTAATTTTTTTTQPSGAVSPRHDSETEDSSGLESWAQKQPIALIDKVDSSSPAHMAGLCPGDAVLRFGSVGTSGINQGDGMGCDAHSIHRTHRNDRERTNLVISHRQGCA